MIDTMCEDIDIKDVLSERTKGYETLEMEIGSGNGKFLKDHAIERSDVYFFGLEYSFKAIKKSVDKASKRDIKNLCVLYGNANVVIEKYLKDNFFFNKIYLNFPDPWPKKRHHNRRILNDRFIEDVYSILKPNGLFYLVTDDKEYAENIMSPSMEKSLLFENMLSSPWVHCLEGYKKTLYEEKMRSLGKEIYFMLFMKI